MIAPSAKRKLPCQLTSGQVQSWNTPMSVPLEITQGRPSMSNLQAVVTNASLSEGVRRVNGVKVIRRYVR